MLIQLAARSLFRNPRRTLAVLLTVAMGSGSLFVFNGFNAGIMNQYRENTVHSRYGHGQINLKGYREKVFEKPWEHWMADVDQLKSKLARVEGVRQVFPRVEFFALLSSGDITMSGKGQGIDGAQESKFFTTLNVEEGSNLADQADGILLGRGLARSLNVKLGDRVTVVANTIHGSMNAIDLSVVGIFHTGQKDFDDVVFRIPLKQAQGLLDTDRVESVALGLNAVTDWPKVQRMVEKELPALEATPFAVLDKVYYQNSVNWLDSQFGVIQSIILTIVILGIFNTVSTAILERKQEIGNLRANGESVGEVMSMLACEGIALGVCGGLLGILAAWGLKHLLLRDGILMPPAPGLTRQFHVLIEFQAAMGVKSFVMSCFAAMAGTLLAGLKVARMPIGEALCSV